MSFPGQGNGEVTDALGVARFEQVPAGDWVFAVQAQEVQSREPDTSGDDMQRVRLVQGEEEVMTLVPPTRASLSGVVTEAGMPLAGADLSLSAVESRGRRRGFAGW